MDFSTIEKLLIEGLPETDNVVGLSVIDREGEVVYKQSFGEWNGSTDVPVMIASATKWFSAAALMSLVDDGILSLDTTVGEHFPQFTGAAAGITLRQCFSHTSGLWGTLFLWPATESHTLADVPDRLAAEELHAEPGEALLYANMGMQLAGAVAQKVTGKSWESLFAERVGAPCGLTATEYKPLGGMSLDVGGTISTTLDDFTAFVAMLHAKGVAADGTRVLSEAAVDTMQTDQTRGARIERSAYRPYRKLDEEFGDARYGVGCWLEDIDPATGRAGFASSGGAFGAMPFIDRRRGFAGVFLTLSRDHIRRRIAARQALDVTSLAGEEFLNPSIAVYAAVRRELRSLFESGETRA